MKKISFGSFPIIEVPADDRKCLDRYLIKSFSDNISISDAIRNLNITKNLMYITPDTLMRDWLGAGHERNVSASDRTNNVIYNQVLKRAFFILKEFYKKIKDAPFYKEYIYYPIYIEKIEKVNYSTQKQSSGDNQVDEEITMNYSFIVLSNDLTKNLKIDEIRYDENASLNFLFLFVEFFSAREHGLSIHDFNGRDLEFLVKLYQFIEQSGKEPIQMVLDLYKLIGLINQATQARTSQEVSAANTAINQFLKDTNIEAFKKYRGLLRHQFNTMLRATGTTNSEQYRRAFIDLMNQIFKNEQLNGLYTGVDTSASRGDRYNYLYQTNKYREILNLAEELVEYNKLTCKDVIRDDPMQFDFKVEHGERTLEVNTQIVSQKYQTFFKDYLGSVGDYLKGLINSTITSFNIDEDMRNSLNINIPGSPTTGPAITLQGYEDIARELNRRLQILDADLRALRTEEGIRERALTSAENALNRARGGARAALIANVQAAQADLYDVRQDISDLNHEREVYVNLLNQIQRVNNIANTMTSDNSIRQLVEALQNRLMSALANDFTFIYDDGKRFFTNELVARGFIELSEDPSTDITTPSGFENVVKSTFPETRTPGGSFTREEANPAFYAAEIVKSLADGFDVLTEDTIQFLGDNLHDILIEILLRRVGSSSLSSPVSGNTQLNQTSLENQFLANLAASLKMATTNPSLQPELENLKNTLRTDIYQNRFLHYVLRNMKRLLRERKVNKVIEFDQNVSQLHPLIRKLISKGQDCQYFKSFIISFDLCEQLYRVKYIADTQKFLDGILPRPPRKLSNPMNRIQTVLYEYLGLKNNPTWIISKQNIYLSMPDDLSLTNTSILSKIPKEDLRKVCQISDRNFWNQDKMGRIASFSDPEIKKLRKKISDIQDEIKRDKDKLKKENDSKKRKGIEDRIRRNQSRIDDLEEKLAKRRAETKNYKPEAFLFDDPDAASKQPLLSDQEREDLAKKEEELRNELQKRGSFPSELDSLRGLETYETKPREQYPDITEDFEDNRAQSTNDLNKRL